ncbi:PREDICTED: uncharacterized protein LOC104413670 [Nestor notabilis]|uniref:uncharacterized protein LOC104413670 n=1 Tax=Nestor notabilis TaxID=176057 RepID=UPI0005239F6C|nr:PREDICTED: uncharacterized protein LOC104413670 [Nestor notabilis]
MAVGSTAERTPLGAPQAFDLEEPPLPAAHHGSRQRPPEAAEENGQSTGDIRRELQKLHPTERGNFEVLLDEAWRVYSNREEEYRQGQRKIAAVVREQEERRPRREPARLAKDQGALLRIKQYPLKKEDREGIQPVIKKFLQLGLLKECESDFNTPVLPVHKPGGSYRVVQDLRPVNKITEDLYPVVANPYTLLTVLTPELTWFTVLDLKDAFFCLPLHEASQKLFAFEWENPRSGIKTQLTWTVLPQGFRKSSTIFGNQLAKDLECWEIPPGEGRLLQYVDHILIATKTEDECVTWTVSLLNFLGLQGGNTGEPVHHDCLEMIETTYASHPDLKDSPTEDGENWFTDGNSYILSAQGKVVNIYTDSEYAFGVVHAHGAIWKERGLLSSQGKNIKHAEKILRLLEADQHPEKVAIMHIKAHQRVSSELEKGNELTDREAKQVAKTEVKTEGGLVPNGQISLEGKPEYTKDDQKLIRDLEGS